MVLSFIAPISDCQFRGHSYVMVCTGLFGIATNAIFILRSDWRPLFVSYVVLNSLGISLMLVMILFVHIGYADLQGLYSINMIVTCVHVLIFTSPKRVADKSSQTFENQNKPPK
jgi:hypothetical protein